MPIVSQVDRVKQLVLTTVFGTVKEENLIEDVTSAWQDPERPYCDELVQARGAVIVHVTPIGLTRIAEIVSRLNVTRARCRVAVVVGPELGAELVKVYQALGPQAFAEVRVVSSNGEAMAWLRPDDR